MVIFVVLSQLGTNHVVCRINNNISFLKLEKLKKRIISYQKPLLQTVEVKFFPFLFLYEKASATEAEAEGKKALAFGPPLVT